MILIVFLFLPLLFSCGGVLPGEQKVLTAKEVEFWAFWKLSDKLFLEFTDVQAPDSFEVEVFFAENAPLRNLLDIPWYRPLPIHRDSLGGSVYISVDSTALARLLGRDDILFMKKPRAMPWNWLNPILKPLWDIPRYVKWIVAKSAIDFWESKEQNCNISKPLFVNHNPLVLLLRNSLSYLAPRKKNAPNELYPHEVALEDAPFRYRVRVYFTRRVTADDTLAAWKSGVNSIDKVLDLPEMIKLARSVDVACIAYLPWSADLPRYLKVEYKGIPEFWNRENWEKVDLQLRERILYHNHLVFDENTERWINPVYLFIPVRIIHDVRLHGESLVKRLAKYAVPKQPYDDNADGFVFLMEDPVKAKIKTFQTSRYWSEVDSVTLDANLTREELDGIVAAGAVKRIMLRGDENAEMLISDAYYRSYGHKHRRK
jgi:hypothetical protein